MGIGGGMNPLSLANDYEAGKGYFQSQILSREIAKSIAIIDINYRYLNYS